MKGSAAECVCDEIVSTCSVCYVENETLTTSSLLSGSFASRRFTALLEGVCGCFALRSFPMTLLFYTALPRVGVGRPNGSYVART